MGRTRKVRMRDDTPVTEEPRRQNYGNDEWERRRRGADRRDLSMVAPYNNEGIASNQSSLATRQVDLQYSSGSYHGSNRRGDRHHSHNNINSHRSYGNYEQRDYEYNGSQRSDSRHHHFNRRDEREVYHHRENQSQPEGRRNSGYRNNRCDHRGFYDSTRDSQHDDRRGSRYYDDRRGNRYCDDKRNNRSYNKPERDHHQIRRSHYHPRDDSLPIQYKSFKRPKHEPYESHQIDSHSSRNEPTDKHLKELQGKQRIEHDMLRKNIQINELKAIDVTRKSDDETLTAAEAHVITRCANNSNQNDLFRMNSNSPQFDDKITPHEETSPTEKKIDQKESPKASKSHAIKDEENIIADTTTDVLYGEKSLMGKYTPQIINHSLTTRKFLVQWNKSGKSLFEAPCRSWVSFDFVFPGVAKRYISKLIKNGDTDRDALKILRDDFAKTEWDEMYNNAIKDVDTEEGEDLKEIDFCCFMCKCDRNATTKSVRNCAFTNKFHRACCHGYVDEDGFEEDFVSSAGRAQMEFLGLLEKATTQNETDEKEIAQIANLSTMTVCSGEQCLTLKASNDAAVVLTINTGVGSVAVALKKLGINTKRIIHVEEDPVIQHVIRYHHDTRYRDSILDDGIDHIVGLYDNLDELSLDPKELVRRYGPIDLIICSSDGNKEHEHKKYTERFFAFCTAVRRLNKNLKQHESLLYLLETYPSAFKATNEQSCICNSRSRTDSKHAFVCNWSLDGDKLGTSVSNPEDDIEAALGLPNKYAFGSVTDLFNKLKTALTAGSKRVQWSHELHPKYWNFLSLGPFGHNFKVDRSKESPIDAMVLEVREHVSSKLLCDSDYAKKVLNRSISVLWLMRLLEPLLGHFDSRQYLGEDISVASKGTMKNCADPKRDGIQNNRNEQNIMFKEEDEGETTDEDRLAAFIDDKPLDFGVD